MATMLFGMVGMLASPDLGRIAAYALVVSAGTLLAAVGLGGAAVTAGALYYLVASTLGIGALFLLIELVERAREPGADVLAVTAEAFGLQEEEPEPEHEVGVAIPATMALLGFAFACSALVIAGLPPLPGFIAKFAMLDALLDAGPVPGAVWTLLALLLASGLVGVISLGRAGVRVFWGEERSIPRVRVIEMAPVAALLAACIALTIAAGPAMRYVHQAAEALHAPAGYIEEVLRAP
jgi:multicomponent K+:H+ antiporter subunit D